MIWDCLIQVLLFRASYCQCLYTFTNLLSTFKMNVIALNYLPTELCLSQSTVHLHLKVVLKLSTSPHFLKADYLQVTVVLPVLTPNFAGEKQTVYDTN